MRGWQEIYRDGIGMLGDDFLELDDEQQDAALGAVPELRQLLFEHACEACYGAPEYGGNRDLTGWLADRHPGRRATRGYSDEEVSNA